MRKLLKLKFTAEEMGVGARKRNKVSSVALVNRMRKRNKKTLKQIVAELDAWRA